MNMLFCDFAYFIFCLLHWTVISMKAGSCLSVHGCSFLAQHLALKKYLWVKDERSIPKVTIGFQSSVSPAPPSSLCSLPPKSGSLHWRLGKCWICSLGYFLTPWAGLAKGLMVTVKLWGVRWRLGAEWQPPSAHSDVLRELFPQSGLPFAGPCKDAEDWVPPSCEIARCGWDLSTAFQSQGAAGLLWKRHLCSPSGLQNIVTIKFWVCRCARSDFPTPPSAPWQSVGSPTPHKRLASWAFAQPFQGGWPTLTRQ